MFARRSSYEEKSNKSSIDNKEKEMHKPVETVVTAPAETPVRNPNVNKILKGSKLIGDINVSCDLEVSGDVDGNISSLQDSNIIIKGLCKGNIETKGGSVDIEGELQDGNIIAGRDVKISGKFNGGEVRAGGKIFVDGKFKGKLEGNDIEIGANSSGKGEIFYKEYISISKGAKVDVHISQIKEALKEIKPQPKTSVAETEPVQKSLEMK